MEGRSGSFRIRISHPSSAGGRRNSRKSIRVAVKVAVRPSRVCLSWRSGDGELQTEGPDPMRPSTRNAERKVSARGERSSTTFADPWAGATPWLSPVGIGSPTSLLNFLRLLAQGREVNHRAANEGRSDLKRSLPRRDSSQDVVVFAQLRWSHAWLPVEDLQIPGAT